MDTMGDRIKRLRLENDWTQEELGNRVGLKRAAINKYEKGNVENMKRSIVEKMSSVFGVSPSYLMALDDSKNIPVEKDNEISLDYYGTVAAGNFEQSATAYDQMKVPANIIKEDSDKYFILKANGDSMNKVIANGHYIVVENFAKISDPIFTSNDIVVVRNGSEYTMKKVRKTDKMVHLEPESYIDEFETQSFPIDDFNELQIIGKVIYSFKQFS